MPSGAQAAVSARRRASSADPLTLKLIAELRPLVFAIHNAANGDFRENSETDALSSVGKLAQAISKASDAPRARDVFRKLQGFEDSLDFLRRFVTRYVDSPSKENVQAALKVAAEVLQLITEALSGHDGNRRFFARRANLGGWVFLREQFGRFGPSSKLYALDSEEQAQLFGLLLAMGLSDSSCSLYFKKLRDQTRNSKPENRASEISEQTYILLPKFRTVQNVDAFPILLHLVRLPWAGKDASQWESLLLATLLTLARESKHNLVAFHGNELASKILSSALEERPKPTVPNSNWELAKILLTLGAPTLEDARNLVKKSLGSYDVQELLLRSLKVSTEPSLIEFDLRFQGYASVELSTINRSFPPTTSSQGYSLSAWFRVDEFDDSNHTTLFGAFDETQKCFVLVYIEKSTRNLILQTSISSARPSVRFKSVVFQAGVWYHLVLLHRRPRATSSSKASLFVNGEFKEQIKSVYPSTPPAASGSKDAFASLRQSSQPTKPVQIFLGTPRDLSSHLGRDLIRTRWSLASAHLFEDVLSDDILSVYYNLGPRYFGNYQDTLGSFQTYEASSHLQMKNEALHPGKEEKSEIVAATRSQAGRLVHESRILFNVYAEAVLDNNDQNTIDESQLIRFLSKASASNLTKWTVVDGHVIAINGAVPSIDEALIQPNGAAVLAGKSIVVNTQPLDSSFWQLAGCVPLALRAIELATTRESVILSVEILFECVKGNWRNSEAMERENGFTILAALLQGKMGHGTVVSSDPSKGSAAIAGGPDEWDKLSFGLLSLVLDFVGYRHSEPEESIIVNQLAYRSLLVDFDIWRKTALFTQQLYFKQFEVFGSTSRHSEFNSKRLQRMRTVKRLIDALKGESVSNEAFPFFISAFKSLVIRNPSAEVLRALSLFITYALHRPLQQSVPTLRPKKSKSSLRDRQLSSPARPQRSKSIERSASNLSEVRNDYVSYALLGTRILEMFADILCKDESNLLVQKFARTVTNRWLLYLLAEDDPHVVILSLKILAKVLVAHGKSYAEKFISKTGGFTIMEQRLKRWWNVSTIWPICFAILFDVDIGAMDFERPFDLFSLLDIFSAKKDVQVVYPETFPIITSLLKSGLQSIVSDQSRSKFPEPAGEKALELAPPKRPQHSRKRSMSLGSELSSLAAQAPSRSAREDADVLQTVSRFFADLHERSKAFRDFAATPKFIQELLFVLYPVIVVSDSVSAETELESRDSALTFDGSDVMIKSFSMSGSESAPIIRTTLADSPSSPKSSRSRPVRIRRGSSFILITSHKGQNGPSTAHLNSVNVSLDPELSSITISNSVVEGLLELVIAVFMDQILERKDFPGFGLFLKVPPGFQEHQVYFNTYILRNTLSHLQNSIQLKQHLLHEPKILTNLSRFTTRLDEALAEGWFLNGGDPTLDFIGTILDYLQRPEVAKIKSVRLCSHAIQTIRSSFMRIILLRLSELDSVVTSTDETVDFLNKILYWQTVILSPENGEKIFLKLMCYLMYTKLVDRREEVRLAAANLWRMTMVQKPEETSDLLDSGDSHDQKSLSNGFHKLMELDNETFIYWVDDHREQLDNFFFGAMSRSWEEYVNEENKRTEEMRKTRIGKRKERLKNWAAEDTANEEIFRRHEVSAGHWSANITASEHVKYQRAMQDHHDDHVFQANKYAKMVRELHRPCGVLDDGKPVKWKLDQTEGRNRMRLCLLPDESTRDHEYQSKIKRSETVRVDSLKLNTKIGSITSPETVGSTPIDQSLDKPDEVDQILNGTLVKEPEKDEEFEFIDGPNSGEGGFEDKNRKVVRTLQRGDQILFVFNISRLIGLEFCEGLLIIGKDELYLLDNFFQRSDGEIINASQASPEERDKYLQMISGRDTQDKKSKSGSAAPESRHWKWSNVLSFSKRRFLFRAVAIEIFFTDGSSYLLTTISPNKRNELYSRLASKASHATGSGTPVNPEDAWRIESLRAQDDEPQTLGSKFANVFGASYSNPATRKWAQGEISNFHYLMLVNTMAGRTFNDLTQYPVFPWVLADYTSEELDLTDPRSFRDLSKPMGCQNPEREEEFRNRYRTFAEMDSSAPSFHYGTHYSSAMIVTSFLIRLQPFVQSYLILQGGNFDHPDRLFYSIQKAWISASRDNMTDVRELIPEFYFLPEFLVNSNNFNFGTLQGTGDTIDTVILPPWAKGDPKIFIAKHKEALESPYVSQHLHQWIDLVFGFKQKGDAALEATNLFHHLSYQGAKDLDNIEDPVERLATIGIIHNFGQTPYQVFQRGHPLREQTSHKSKRLDTAVESLTELPFPLLETDEKVSSLIFSVKQDRLLCSAAFRLNIPPNYDKYMEWGFIDGSVRFYTADSRKMIGLSEHLHCRQLSCAIFADSRTLITGGSDCTVSAWTITTESKSVDLQPRSTLFGHTSPISVLALSHSFNVLLSASTDGVVYLWDLNRLEFIRKLDQGDPVECARVNDITGDILLCRGGTATLYTLNGEEMLSQNIRDTPDDTITSCAFYEGVADEWLERDLIFTGHRRGIVNVWQKTVSDGAFVLKHLKRLNHVDRTSEVRANVQAAITCILPMPQSVYTGDADGRVMEWNCVQRAGAK